MSNEAAARELRLEIGKLSKTEEVLEGLALVDPGEQARLALVREAIRDRTGRLGELQLEARR